MAAPALIRGLGGLDLVGATVMDEILCILAEAVAVRRKGRAGEFSGFVVLTGFALLYHHPAW